MNITGTFNSRIGDTRDGDGNPMPSAWSDSGLFTTVKINYGLYPVLFKTVSTVSETYENLRMRAITTFDASKTWTGEKIFGLII